MCFWKITASMPRSPTKKEILLNIDFSLCFIHPGAVAGNSINAINAIRRPE
jgi:hypothetical protein